MSSIPKDEDPGWPPRATETIGFSTAEARGLLPTRKPRARVAAVGTDLELAAPLSDSEIARQNLKMLHRILVLALIVAGVSITLSIVSSIVVWGAVARASEVASVVSEHITANEIDNAVQSAFGSIHDVKSTTGSAANLALEVEEAGDRVVAAVNSSAAVLERLVSVASRLADHPSVSLALGTGGR